MNYVFNSSLKKELRDIIAIRKYKFKKKCVCRFYLGIPRIRLFR